MAEKLFCTTGVNLWIVEWVFRGKSDWQPISRPPFRSMEEATNCKQRRTGFEYRIVEYMPCRSTAPEGAIMLSQPENERWYRKGFIEGQEAGLKVATDVMNKQLPPPIFIEKAGEPGFDEATETRWQNAIYELCKKSVGPENDHIIDGGGCDSGDALDFTLTEISQAINFYSDSVPTD